MLSLISLPVNFCSVPMASRRSNDKSPATTNPIVKKEPVSSLDIVNRFTPLGTIHIHGLLILIKNSILNSLSGSSVGGPSLVQLLKFSLCH